MNRKECLKIMVRCVAFVVVFSMLFGNATDLLMRHDDESNEIHAFYSEPEDTIDVLYVGSSPLLRGVSPMVMWQEHGFTGYVRASALQAPSVSYGLLAESLKYQNPELVVLLCDNIFSDYDYAEREGDLRRGLDGMKMSKYKLDIIKEVTAADEAALDRYEGFPNFYYKKDIRLQYKGIRTGRRRTVTAFAYIMHEDRPIGVPSDSYMHTCMEGYDTFRFDKRVLTAAYEKCEVISHER